MEKIGGRDKKGRKEGRGRREKRKEGRGRREGGRERGRKGKRVVRGMYIQYKSEPAV